jgi:hypothetical protein
LPWYSSVFIGLYLWQSGLCILCVSASLRFNSF